MCVNVNHFMREIQKEHFSTQILKNLGLSTSTLHNIVKRSKESGELSICVGQGWKPRWNVRDLCYKNVICICDVPILHQ